MAKFHNPLDKKNKKASGKRTVTRTTSNTNKVLNCGEKWFKMEEQI